MKPPSALLSLIILPSLVTATTLTKITTPFGPNPRNVSFNIYVPDALPPNPAILAAFACSQWATLASKHGFIVIYPGSPNAADQCWDVSSRETLTHDGGGDSLGIVSMVRWTIDRYRADRARVFVTGVSSGGMMTQVLVGAYPDVFAAGAAFAGMPFGCFAPEGDNSGEYDYWNAECATGKVTRSAEEWGAIVNFGEAVKQWTEVMGVSEAPASVVPNTPLAGWTKRVYGPSGWLEAYSAERVSHDIKVQEDTVMAFFRLNCTSGCFSWGKGSPCEANSSTTSAQPSSTFTTSSIASSTSRIGTISKSTVAVTTTTTASPNGQTLWGQCGGIGNGYAGATACATGSCTTYNPWYAQCVPMAVYSRGINP
ncbi:Alpha/Beta hydrolase protein [Achaetomium macrosporum]|uniref:Alpha/Beta hydrolase protein n=1 Tax=Achaetomium macrosporum TaxID=79813 RepID=A0AAN7C7T1_9PEZI|nr:Alpha/Beta hydrolase protein [Achaetomium macrosporum]